ncbi:MAG: hypothetical protein R3300_05380, partial [Candidatus Promineifilaceae bacterium]|nr:hypothetical protein [Candidatus Promineifilaceae bacterium]
QAGELHGLAWGHQMAAAASLAAGQYEAVEEHAERSLALYTAIGDLHLANVPRSALADLARRRGDFGQATAIYRQALQVWYDVGNVGAVARIVECLAFTLRVQETDEKQTGALNQAAILLGAAEALRGQHQAPMNFVERREYEHERAALQEAMAADTFAADWQRGRAMTLRQAISFALEG